jgi:hypothetical protein
MRCSASGACLASAFRYETPPPHRARRRGRARRPWRGRGGHCVVAGLLRQELPLARRPRAVSAEGNVARVRRGRSLHRRIRSGATHAREVRRHPEAGARRLRHHGRQALLRSRRHRLLSNHRRELRESSCPWHRPGLLDDHDAVGPQSLPGAAQRPRKDTRPQAPRGSI